MVSGGVPETCADQPSSKYVYWYIFSEALKQYCFYILLCEKCKKEMDLFEWIHNSIKFWNILWL